MTESFIRPKGAAKQAGLSVSHMYRLIAQNKFPQPVRVSERISAFLESEISEWVIERTAEARAQSGAEGCKRDTRPLGDNEMAARKQGDAA